MVALLQLAVFLSYMFSDSVVIGQGISDMAGTQFVLAFPTHAKNNRFTHFLLYTPEVLINVTVNLTTKWSTAENVPEKTVTINREEMKMLTIHEKFSLNAQSRWNVKFDAGILLHLFNHTDVSERFTYVLSGNGRFCATVLIHTLSEKRISMAALQALPVEGWGKAYYAFSLAYHPSIQITTVLANIVTIKIRSPRDLLQIKYKEMYYNDQSLMRIELQAYKGFSLQACPNFNHNYGSISGTVIEGKNPIGVISGNCEGYDDYDDFDKYDEFEKCQPPEKLRGNLAPITDMVMESLLPQYTMGISFILYGHQNYRQRMSRYIVLASQANTVITQHFNPGVGDFYNEIHKRGDHVSIIAYTYASLLTTDKPVTVYFINHTKCNFNGSVAPGDGAMTLVVPIGLFMHFYIWVTPDIAKISGTPIQHYLYYVSLQSDFNETLFFDNKLMNTYNQESYLLDLTLFWQLGQLEIQPGQHELFSTVSAKLGAYLYGIGDASAYMYPAGFISSPINDSWACKKMTKKGMVRGDLIDNDCDGRVDEEQANNIDDDHDEKVDEDVVALPPRNGSWSQWHPWWCTSCNGTTRIRTRQCNNPLPIRGGHDCVGDRMEMQISKCLDICQTVHGEWSDWQPWMCTLECGQSIRTRKCDNPAPVFNGLPCRGDNSQSRIDKNCKNCPPGWTLPTTTVATASTTKALIVYTEAVPQDGSWGQWSNWSCTTNCRDKRMHRTRSCDSPAPVNGGRECLGPPAQITEDDLCTLICPDECPNMYWGLNCTNNCLNCESACDKNTGVCETCKPGYELPKQACKKECNAFFYGFDCRGNCVLDCDGEDCLDKVTGTCPPPKNTFNFKYLLLLLLLVPMGILCYLPHYYKRREIGESDAYDFTELELVCNVDGPMLPKTASTPTQTGFDIKSTTSRTSKVSRSSRMRMSSAMMSNYSEVDPWPMH